MKNKTILYFVRAEADLERIVSMAIPGKGLANQKFVFYGDTGLTFDRAIRNTFQKHLLTINKFEMVDAIEYSFIGRVYKAIDSINTRTKYARLLIDIIQKVLFKLIFNRQALLAVTLINKINPNILITDNSTERENYFPHYLRQAALKNHVAVHVTGHGAAGGLHKDYSSYDNIVPDGFKGCIVGVASKHDYGSDLSNRIITGDPAESLPNLSYKHKQTFDDIEFLNDRKYKIGFFMAAPFETCTNGWSVMEEIMLDYAGDDRVAMVVKLHPRLYKFGDYRYLKKINNLKLFGSELDRSKLVKWADIVVCSDHCSTIFEPMIFRKKVVAIHSKKVRQFAHYVSPVHDSDKTMNSIHSSAQFELEGLTNYTSDMSFIDEYCWGNQGSSDLGENILKRMFRDSE